VAEVAFMFEYFGGWATKIDGDVQHLSPDAMFMVWKEPMGVAVGITPWNYPLMMATQKLAPALAAGCTFILKPPEQTPLTCLQLPAILEEAGLPRGVFHVLTGFGETAGAPLVASPKMDKVLHGLPRGRQDHHAFGCRHPETRDARARRQVADHRVR
jgi:betaine-aldehyde dehydrogenase